MRDSRPSVGFIEHICDLYGDVYDDRVEDCRPPAAGGDVREPGADWVPGQQARHKSLAAFQAELEGRGVKLSTSKIKKILISGGCWTTGRSREIAELYERFTAPVADGGRGMSGEDAVAAIAAELGVSLVTVSVNLPYRGVVYKLENRSKNAMRCARYRASKRVAR